MKCLIMIMTPGSLSNKNQMMMKWAIQTSINLIHIQWMPIHLLCSKLVASTAMHLNLSVKFMVIRLLLILKIKDQIQIFGVTLMLQNFSIQILIELCQVNGQYKPLKRIKLAKRKMVIKISELHKACMINLLHKSTILFIIESKQKIKILMRMEKVAWPNKMEKISKSVNIMISMSEQDKVVI